MTSAGPVELLVYLYAIRAGFPLEDRYEAALNGLFEQHPKNELLLELELLSSDYRESLALIERELGISEYELSDKAPVPEIGLSPEQFCRRLMEEIGPLYEPREARPFIGKLYILWQWLPSTLEDIDLFYVFRRAGDPTSWTKADSGVITVCCEDMLGHYNRK